MSVLEVNDVSIRYLTGDFKDIGLKEYVTRRLTNKYHINEFWADKHVSFTLEKGDMLGVIGTNGAGKSTLLKVISGIMEPSEGTVHREGNVVALLELGSGFDGDLTVRENTYLRGAMLGYTREFMDKTYQNIIDFAELHEFEDYPFKQLSSGMQSRLAFSIASLINPDILILDEVLSVGDGGFRRKSEEKMKEIIESGATTIFVTHSISQIREMCNKVLWLEKGEQVVFGSNVNQICDEYEDFLVNPNKWRTVNLSQSDSKAEVMESSDRNSENEGSSKRRFNGNKIMTQEKSFNTLKTLLDVFAVFLTCLTLIYIFTNFTIGFHSDSAAANILAREQQLTGEYFPHTWNLSTGVTIISLNNIINLFSHLTSNQVTLRSLAVAFYSILLIFAIVLYSKKIIKSNFFTLFFCLFLSNTSRMVQDMTFAQAAYLTSLLDNIISIFLLTASLDENLKIRNKKCFFLLNIYTAYLAMYGTINFAYQIIPLFGCIFFYIFIENDTIGHNILKKRLINSAKIIIPLILVSAVGVVIYNKIVIITDFSSEANITYPEGDRLIDGTFYLILRAIGYRTGVELFTVQGIMNFVVVCVFLICLTACVNLIKRYKNQSFAVKLLINYSITIFALFIYFDIFVYSSVDIYDRYFYKPLVFIWILASYCIYSKLQENANVVNVLVTAAAISAFSFPYMLSELPTTIHFSQQKETQMGLVNFLKSNGLEYGYATFWNAGSNMVLSDFQIQIGGITLNSPIQPYRWLSSNTVYEPDSFSGPTFLLLSDEENKYCEEKKLLRRYGMPANVLDYNEYTIYVYPYNISENDFKGEQVDEYIYSMAVSDYSMLQDDGTIKLESGQIIYGPYITLEEGKYEIDLEFANMISNVLARFTSDAGGNEIEQHNINESHKSIVLQVSSHIENFEVVLTSDDPAYLKSIKIIKRT